MYISSNEGFPSVNNNNMRGTEDVPVLLKTLLGVYKQEKSEKTRRLGCAASGTRKSSLVGVCGCLQATGPLCVCITPLCVFVSANISWLSNSMTLTFVNDLYPNSQIKLRYHTYNTNNSLRSSHLTQTVTRIRGS